MLLFSIRLFCFIRTQFKRSLLSPHTTYYRRHQHFDPAKTWPRWSSKCIKLFFSGVTFLLLTLLCNELFFSQNAFLLHYYKSFYLLFRKVGFVKYIFFCTWFCSLKKLNEQKLKRVLINVLNNFIMFLIWIFKLWIVWVETIWQLSPKQKDQLQTGKLYSSRTHRLIIDTSSTKEFFSFSFNQQLCS